MVEFSISFPTAVELQLPAFFRSMMVNSFSSDDCIPDCCDGVWASAVGFSAGAGRACVLTVSTGVVLVFVAGCSVLVFFGCFVTWLTLVRKHATPLAGSPLITISDQ